MRSLLQQLENNEAILQLYLAGELDEQDQQEVAQLLAADKGLAQQLRQMQADHAAVMGAMATLDAAPVDAGAQAHRLRQVSRLIKRWQVEQLSRPPRPAAPRSLNIPMWTYPAAAAAVLCVVLGWWGMSPDNALRVQPDNHDGTVALKTDGSNPDAPPPVAMDVTTATSATALSSVWPLTQPDEASAAEDPEMAEAQQQASTLVRRSNDAALTASIFMTDNNE